MAGKLIVARLTAIYSGQLRFLPPDGEKTGIFKTQVDNAMIDSEGIIGDIQADRRFHGGPEKALHQFAQSSYQSIINQFPMLENLATAGSMGENISSNELDDSNVYIGDSYEIGNVIVQVSQPRRPCWKINRKFDVDPLAKFIARQQITGWYYRVLKTGRIYPGDTIKLVDRSQDSLTVKALTQLSLEHRPDTELLNTAIQCPGLNQQWKTNFKDRLAFINKLR